MLITKNIKIDFVQRGMPPQLHAVQGDCLSRDICIYLYDGGTPWEVPVDATPVLRFGRTDGSGGLYDTLPDGNLAWAIDGNRVSVILAPAVLAAAGLVQCQLILLQGEACLSTFSFDIIVEPDPSLGATESESYYNWSRKFIEVPQAAVGQIIQVKAVDTEGVATEWEAVELPKVPAALPNPYPLILTGAVNAEYDGNSAVRVEIPEGGGGGGLSRVLLWENADPYSEFAAQTIQLNDLHTYDAIEILYVVGIYSPGYGLSFMSSGNLPNLIGAWGIPYDLGYVLSAETEFDIDTDRAYRGLCWSVDSITFRDAYDVHYYGDTSMNNSNIVPARIYGIKGGN